MAAKGGGIHPPYVITAAMSRAWRTAFSGIFFVMANDKPFK